MNIADKWIPELCHHCPNVPVLLIGTKNDLTTDPVYLKTVLIKREEKPISFEQGELLAQKLGCISYIETSAKTNYGIDDLEEMMLKCISMSNNPKNSREQKPKCEIQ